MKKFTLPGLALCTVLLTGCGSVFNGGNTARTAMHESIGAGDKVALLPVANFTDVPQAGLRVEALIEPALRQAGLRQLAIYPPILNPETLFEPSDRKVQLDAEKWARSQGIRYAVAVAVNEWRYKVGVDGEPAVGLMVQIKDLRNDQVIYSAAGGRTGGSREAISAVGLRLTTELLAGIQIEQVSPPTNAR
jgi:polysaccharide biosynthesis protein PelC